MSAAVLATRYSSIPLAFSLLSGPSVGDTSNNIDFASTSFIPTAGKQLWVFVHYENPGVTLALAAVGIGFPTGGANGLSFTQVSKAAKNTNAECIALFKADQLTPSSPISMQLSLDSTDAAASTGIIWGVIEASVLAQVRSISGVPQIGTLANGGTGTASSVSMPGFTLGTSAMLTALAAGANPLTGLTPPFGHTNRLNTGHGTPTRGLSVDTADINAGITTTTIAYTGTNPSTAKAMIAAELIPV